MTQNILLQFQKYTVLGKSLEFQGMHLLGLKMACHLLSSDGFWQTEKELDGAMTCNNWHEFPWAVLTACWTFWQMM